MRNTASLTIVASLFCCFFVTSSVSATPMKIQAVVYSETFDTDAANLAAVELAYPELSGVGTVSVSGGQVQMARTTNADDSILLTDQIYNEEIWVTGEIGQTSTNPGSTAPALVVGNRAFEFFPGNGAFRIYAINPLTGDFGSQLSGPGNIAMGFAPPLSVLHAITVHSDNTGNLDVTVVDSTNPANVYNGSFFFPGFVPGGVGFSENHNSGTYIFDNLQVEALVEIPEPSSILLLGLGAISLVRHTRRLTRRERRRA